MLYNVTKTTDDVEKLLITEVYANEPDSDWVIERIDDVVHIYLHALGYEKVCLVSFNLNTELRDGLTRLSVYCRLFIAAKDVDGNVIGPSKHDEYYKNQMIKKLKEFLDD